MQYVTRQRTLPRVLFAGAIASGLLLAVAIARPGRGADFQSSIVSEDALRAHGVELAPVPFAAAAARIDAAQARETAIEIAKMSDGPKETHRVFARPTAGEAPRTSWLLLFDGGDHGGSLGPPEGADTRSFATAYTGVLIDDQTGDLLYWFQGGSFAP